MGNGWLFNADFLFAEIPTDDANFGSYGSASFGMECFTFDPTLWLIAGKWPVLYYGVQRANDVIRVLAKVPEGAMTADETLQVKAEATFLRAYYHLQLAMIYEHVPYVDETISFENGNYDVTNTEPIWPKIEADFQFAADNLSPTKPDAGRANSWAAKSFLAKVYMFEHEFTKAQTLLAGYHCKLR